MNHEDFLERFQPHRRELVGFCYRMLGSVDDAEDAVQDASIRAWRAYERFEERASFRSWLYAIATNVCLTERSRRVLPSTLGAPCADPDATPVPADVPFIEPIPDDLLVLRENARLALIASFQLLPPRQRAALILRDVLDFSAEEAAEMLELTTPALKSALQRARATVAEASPETTREPTAPEATALLARYIDAFQRSDPGAITALLCEDAALEMVPVRTWFSGKATCAPFLRAHALFAPGDWRMTPTSANGQPAAIAYLRGAPYGVAVLTLRPTGIGRIVVFGGTRYAERFIASSDRPPASVRGS